jgi:ribosomal protein L37AE/L43A
MNCSDCGKPMERKETEIYHCDQCNHHWDAAGDPFGCIQAGHKITSENSIYYYCRNPQCSNYTQP